MRYKLRWKRSILSLALLCLLSSAATVSMLVPAVMTESEGSTAENGRMLRVSIEERNGTGQILTSTSPLTGIDAQSSERSAVQVGASRAGAGVGSHDFIIVFDASDARRIDGPSAGAAMSLLTTSALTGRPIRPDFTITGAINSDGTIGAVGSIPEKVEAAAATGLSVMAVPASSGVFDKILIASLRQKLSIALIEVATIEEAEQVAFTPQGSTPPEIAVPSPEAPLSGLADYSYECPSCRVDLFSKFSLGVVTDLEAAVAEANSSGRASYSGVMPFIEKGALDSREMARAGYYYTGANNAFLSLIDAHVLLNSTINRAGLDAYLSGVDRCGASLSRPSTTLENLEFVAGGDLRAAWAKRKAAEVRSREQAESQTQEGLLTLYRDALYAGGWCQIAGGLYAAGREAGGEPVNESALQGFAAARLSEARMIYEANFGPGSDAEWHLGGAEEAFNSSHYYAAVLGSDYVLAFADSGDYSGMGGHERASRAREISSTKGTTLWSALFYAHAKFFMETEGDDGEANAITLGLMAEKFGADAQSAKGFIANPGTAPTPPAAQAETGASFLGFKVDDAKLPIILSLCALLIISQAISVFVMMRMRAAIRSPQRLAPPQRAAPARKPPARRRRG